MINTGDLSSIFRAILRSFAIGLLLLPGAIPLQAEQEPVQILRIGAILPLTGPSADYGEAVRNSIELARVDEPTLLHAVQFIYEDAMYDSKTAVTAFQKLATKDRVDAVYVWGIAFCKAVAPLAEAAKIPMIGQCIDPAIGRDRRYVIRFMNYTDQYLRATSDYLFSKGLKRLSVVVTENPYLEEMLAALGRNLLPGQTISLVQRFPTGEMDFRSVLSRLRQTDTDAIGVFLSAGQISSFYRQMKEQRLTFPTFGTNFFESLSEIESAKGAMDGAIFANNDVRPEYLAKYQKRFGRVTQIGFGALAYEFTTTLGKIVSRRSQALLRGEELLKEFQQVERQEGKAAGPYGYAFEPAVGSYFKFPIVVKEIRGLNFRAAQ